MYERLIVNIGGSRIREETLDGQKYIVAPAAMIEEGVWEGSKGPVYYPDAEIKKSERVWNHKPIVVYHPQDSQGRFTTACSQDIIERCGVGLLLNTKKDKKLTTECWINEAKANRVDSRVLAEVRAERQVETSTGLDVDAEEGDGEWNGKKYKITARNFRPDHLAILPDKLGAYSIADGGGILANEKALLRDTADQLPESLRVMLAKALHRAYRQGGVVVNERTFGEGKLTVNELSYDERTRQLSELLREKYGKPGRYWEGHVHSVYDGWCVYCDGTNNYEFEYYIQKFNMKDDVVSLSGEPSKAKKVVEYVTMEGASFVQNSAGQLETKETTTVAETQFDKKAHVDSLIGSGWTEEQRQGLMDTPDPILQVLKPVKEVANTTPPVTPPATPPAQPPATPPPQTPPTPPKFTMKDIIENSDPRTKERWAEFERMENETINNLVTTIKANPANQFTEEYLKAQPIGFLRSLAAIANSVQGQVEATSPSGSQYQFWGAGGGTVANAAPAKKPAPLLPLSTMPVHNEGGTGSTKLPAGKVEQ